MRMRHCPLEYDTIHTNSPSIADYTTENGVVYCRLYVPELYSDDNYYCDNITAYTPIDGEIRFGYRYPTNSAPLNIFEPIIERFVDTPHFQYFMEYFVRTQYLCISFHYGVNRSDLDTTKSVDKYMKKFFTEAITDNILQDCRMLPWFYTYIETWTNIAGDYPEQIVDRILSHPIGENIIEQVCKEQEYVPQTYHTPRTREIIMNHYNTNWLKVAIKESHKALVELHEKHVTTPVVTNPENINKFSKVHFQVPIPNYSR